MTLIHDNGEAYTADEREAEYAADLRNWGSGAAQRLYEAHYQAAVASGVPSAPAAAAARTALQEHMKLVRYWIGYQGEPLSRLDNWPSRR